MKRQIHALNRYRNEKFALIILIPALILFLIFSYTPLIMALFRSFKSSATGEWVGFENYDFVLKTPAFMQSFKNVLIMASIVIVLIMILSFAFAHLIIHVTPKIAGITKTLIYVPGLMSPVVTMIIINLLIRYGKGLISSILISLDMDLIYFNIDGIWPYTIIIIATLWLALGYNTLIMLAGRLNVPKEYYEAAQIDGANKFKLMIYITIPNMKNYFLLMLVNLVVINLQMMEIPLFLTGGGPVDSTLTPALYLYNSFNDLTRDRNVTIAGSILVMLLIVFINLIAFKFIRSKRIDD